MPRSGEASAPAPPADARRLGRVLTDCGFLSAGQVHAALEEQHRTGGRLGDILLAWGMVDPPDLVLALAEQRSLPSLVLEYNAVPALPRDLAYRRRAAVLSGPSTEASEAVLVAVVDLRDVPALELELGRPIEPRLTDNRTMDALLADAYADIDGRAAALVLRRGALRRWVERVGGGAVAGVLTLALASALLRPILILAGAVGAASLYWLLRAHLHTGTTVASAAKAREAPSDRPAAWLPVHTVLIVLNRETPAGLRRMRHTLEQLGYPSHRLQAIALLDSTDRVTRRSLRAQPLPPWVVSLPVPPEAASSSYGMALYGLRQARGQLVTVGRPEASLTADTMREAARALAGDRGAPDGDRGTAEAELPVRRSHLARRFLREVRPSPVSALAPSVVSKTRRSSAHFPTRDLQTAFGWDRIASSGRRGR